MKDSKIEWCDHTFNPWIGCTKISPGCEHCFAEVHDQRFYEGIHWGKGATRRKTSDANWKQPLKWHRDWASACKPYRPSLLAGLEQRIRTPKRPRVFCGSLCDWLDDEVPIEWLANLLTLIHATPSLDWLLLTKRPENFHARLNAVLCQDEREDDSAIVQPDGTPGWALATAAWTGMYADQGMKVQPFDNVWIGTTVENQEMANKRIPALLEIPANVRFLSCEPLIGAVELRAVWKINWVICGGESGPKARPMHPDWVRSLRDQCKVAGVPFLFKQWGEWQPYVDEERFTHGDTETTRNAHVWMMSDGTEGLCWIRDDDGDFQNWTGEPPCQEDGNCVDGMAIFSRVGKKSAGRRLDGVTHNEFPVIGGVR